jgi:radical SAM protein with 4Fe4S-binding SPASM domain
MTQSNLGEFYFQWHITNRCNFRCVHCYQEDYSISYEMSLGELKSVADKLIQALYKWKKKGRIAITGGEPLVKRELFPLLEYLEQAEEVSSLDVLSNGTLINDKVANKLQNFSKLRRVQISLDGARPEIHDAIRGDGAFEEAVRGIRILRQHGIKVYIMFTLQRCNVKDIPLLFDLAMKEDISGLTVERLVPCGSGLQIKDQLLSPEEIRDVFQYISDRADLEYEKGNQFLILKYRTLWVNIDSERAKADVNTPIHKELGAICSIGIDSLCILPDATVLPCRRLNIPIGNLKQDSIFKIWYTSDVLWKIRDKRNLKGKCNSCEFIPRCSGCRAMAYACTGDYLQEDPQCWKQETQKSGKSVTSMCSIN